MAKKYLKTIEVVKQTGCSYDEILDLVRTNVLSGYKTKRGHWRLSVESVEKHFGILINEPSTVKAPKISKQDKDDKLICGHTARKYLGCSKAEFESLVEQGFIQACRDDYGRWRVSKQSILNYTARSHTSSDTRLISNESHYQEVIERICAAKLSIRIMTANFRITTKTELLSSNILWLKLFKAFLFKLYVPSLLQLSRKNGRSIIDR